MNNTLSKADFYIKHILSSEWIPTKYISETDKYITFVVEDTNNIFFEKNDKIIYSIKTKSKNHSYNTVVCDVDYPTYDKIMLTLEKPLERRLESRYNINIPSSYILNGSISDTSIVDVSKTGFKMVGNSILNLKDEIDLNIVITDTEIFNTKCKVVYRIKNNEYSKDYKYIYGLKITKILEQDKKLLLEFINSLN